VLIGEVGLTSTDGLFELDRDGTNRVADLSRQEHGSAQVLADTRCVVDPVLRSAVEKLSEPSLGVSSYHFGWRDQHGEPVTLGTGKRIRPALALLAAQAADGQVVDAVPAAVAVELVHNFSLLHDDIMDGDRTRHDRPTSWVLFGVPAAILAGDALLALAVQILADTGPRVDEAIRILAQALVDLVHGQGQDMDFSCRERVGLDECVTMAAGKTAALIRCACELGTLVGGGSPRQVRCLSAFGEHLGLAFQLVDDLLGLWGDPHQTGKPTGADVAARKKSLPVTAALSSGTAAGDELAELYRRGGELTPIEIRHGARLVEIAGGRAWTQNQAEWHVREALYVLSDANLEPTTSGELQAITHLITDRTR
jgi:geranylgeranyl diphosphate synthase, type I